MKFLGELKNVYGGEQGRCHSMHAGFLVLLRDMASCDDFIGKERSSSSAHLS